MVDKKHPDRSQLSIQSTGKKSSDELNPSQTISLIAHELKNPLASIRGYTELLLSGAAGEVNPAQKKFLSTILSNVDRVTELLTDINDSAKIDSGFQKIELEPLQPLPIIQEMVENLQPQCAERNISLLLDSAGDLPLIKADKVRFKQILSNLLVNAIKYSTPGGIVRLSTEVQANELAFTIQDNGIGILPEQQGRIFQAYYRTDDVQTREIPGTGLGLYITRRLVELQGGRIWFESEYQKGTSFHFTLQLI